ncbi:MAG: hypothetical protein ACM3MK_04510 [Chitinophagales bacterium]
MNICLQSIEEENSIQGYFINGTGPVEEYLRAKGWTQESWGPNRFWTMPNQPGHMFKDLPAGDVSLNEYLAFARRALEQLQSVENKSESQIAMNIFAYYFMD